MNYGDKGGGPSGYDPSTGYSGKKMTQFFHDLTESRTIDQARMRPRARLSNPNFPFNFLL